MAEVLRPSAGQNLFTHKADDTMRCYVPVVLAAALLVGSGEKKEEPQSSSSPPPVVTPDAKPAVAPSPPPPPDVPKDATAESPKPGQVNDHSNPEKKKTK